MATKRFHAGATIDQAVFYDEAGQPTVNVALDGSVSENINVDSTSVSSNGTYVGKAAAATDANFTVAYTSGTTVTFSGYPAGVSGFHADDIEFVRQIDSTGAVVETYSRDDAAMSITGDVLTVTGASFGATDTFVVGTNVANASAGGGASSAVGGGNNTYSNASGDFTATITNATKNITITGLPFTLEAIHVVAGSIKKIDSSDVVTNVALTDVAVSGGVITLADTDNFVTGDTVMVTLVGPDKAYDVDIDNQLTAVQNPDYSHYTSVENIISQTNLGITATADGTDTNTLNDADGAFDAENVAVGYEAYSEEEDTAATVLSITDASNIETDAITDWTGDTYWLPECERYVIDAESYRYLSIHTRLATTDADNAAYIKIYGSNDADADATDDTYWVDLSSDIFGAAQLSCSGATGTQEGIYFVDTSRILLKYMIKIVGEVTGGGAAAAAAQAFDVYIKKGY